MMQMLLDEGAVAIALAFAQLAAMTAATLDFLFGFGVLGNIAVERFGHAFSSCFLAVASRVSIITLPRSCQICSKSKTIIVRIL